ncbi:MAG: hypothetical protein ISS65_03715 [Desulfobacterales bacterium]|uniref:Cysteinyl-tRNA ligase anticodon binding domain-containing protein n=1 Tax=Candidatus Desulfatibia profunda TaxID=2841695 RepID=A0A8J6TNB5_9BACT|nr:hypothetical protein [Candidatus Desulfatibia profunda]MBL7179301.1 hypothetical protein [Desulfobacterales bacterium]
MTSPKGTIVLMGSGELAATMVEVHKELLAILPDPRLAVFLDTPAGFQLNANQLSEKAVAYFRSHVRQPMTIASLQCADTATDYEVQQALQTLRQADFILIGPGSPTYAVRQWRQTAIPDIFSRHVENGGCLVAASAAALTVGRLTLPVYEIYKVGEKLHWFDGLNLLGRFGMDLVVIPHWNNAEGGTHDTRFCYMGAPRFRLLESQLPEDVAVLGVDEHTACIIDVANEQVLVKGLGCVTLRRRGVEKIFEKGACFGLDILRGSDAGSQWRSSTTGPKVADYAAKSTERSFGDTVRELESAFNEGLEQHDPKTTTNALLELDRRIWQAQQELESQETISQAREILREQIVLLGNRIESAPRNTIDCLAPLVEELLALREHFRNNRQWTEADAIRDRLEQAHILIEDTENGPRWQLAQISHREHQAQQEK